MSFLKSSLPPYCDMLDLYSAWRQPGDSVQVHSRVGACRCMCSGLEGTCASRFSVCCASVCCASVVLCRLVFSVLFCVEGSARVLMAFHLFLQYTCFHIVRVCRLCVEHSTRVLVGRQQGWSGANQSVRTLTLPIQHTLGTQIIRFVS